MFKELYEIEELRLNSGTTNNLRLKSHNKQRTQMELKFYTGNGRVNATATVKVQMKNNALIVSSKKSHTVEKENSIDARENTKNSAKSIDYSEMASIFAKIL